MLSCVQAEETESLAEMTALSFVTQALHVVRVSLLWICPQREGECGRPAGDARPLRTGVAALTSSPLAFYSKSRAC